VELRAPLQGLAQNAMPAIIFTFASDLARGRPANPARYESRASTGEGMYQKMILAAAISAARFY